MADTELSPKGGLTQDEKEAIDKVIRPDDSYNENGVYWADLPVSQRISFVTSVDNKETASELKWLWEMFKQDPLSPISYYFKNFVIPGAGLGLEGYVLFSIGNVSPLFSAVWPECWSKYEVCDKNWVAAVTYLEICGIIVGQCMVGYLGDAVGRRWGLIQDAGVMTLGLVMLVAAWGTSLNGWVICYAWSLFFYSIGVGGEYPMTVTMGMENGAGSGKVSSRYDRLHRGRKVVGAFLMQGWGVIFNQAIIMILLVIFNSGSTNPPYSASSVQWTYRISFAIPAVGTLWLVYYRAYHLKAASKQLNIAKKKNRVTGYDTESLKLTIKHFGGRLFATCGAWFMNDVFVYGNKLFQGQFIAVLVPGTKSVYPNWEYNMLNAAVSLVGYYLASFFIDNKLYGRKWMQNIGFLMDFILFTIPAFDFGYYSKAGIHSFQAMYFLSSFFIQFGPNAVTFLTAGEVFPTPVRATAHGLSAACGKLGALFAGVLYNYITTQQRFYLFPWFGLAGVVLTFVWLPDTTGLDLKEQERRWKFIRENREHEYHGVAIHPNHLSLWERFRGVGKNYNPELDYQQKVAELRAEWEATMADKSLDEKDLISEDSDESLYEGQIHDYFKRTTPSFTGSDNAVLSSNEKDFNAASELASPSTQQ